MRNHAHFLVSLIVLTTQSICYSQESTEKSETVLITGACGFIGSNFLDYMYHKYPDYKFIVLDSLSYAGSLENIPNEIQHSNRFKFVHESIVNYPVVNKLMANSDYVVHFAAETHVTRSIIDDFTFFETDVLGTRALLKALVNHRDKVKNFIHISTSEVYGTAEYQPMDEVHPLNPRSPYAAAKTAADRLVYAYHCTYGVPVVIIRPFNNYGPHQHPEKMIPRFIDAAIKKEPLTIHGDGLQTRDWLNVWDTCQAVDMVMHASDFSTLENQEINIGSGIKTSVLDIAKIILKEFNLSEDYLKFVEDRPGQVECHIAGRTKAEKLLNWTPQVSLEKGLIETINWYKKHPEFLERFNDECEECP